MTPDPWKLQQQLWALWGHRNPNHRLQQSSCSTSCPEMSRDSLGMLHTAAKTSLLSIFPLLLFACTLTYHKAMAPHSSTLAWKIPWMEEPGGLQSMGSLRVGHDWATSLSRIEEGNGNPLQCSCLENPRDRGAWWAAVYGVTQSQTWLSDLAAAAATYHIF